MVAEFSLSLTHDEAWVLFELVRRYSDTDALSIIDQAEQRALWNLCCVFEKQLHQGGEMSHEQFIEQCRARLRDAP
ncbi:MAG: hypothetical protein KDI56_06875 [Xanthomonadales bacterium]|nr:hypothetical protein [Xanthomonadales bacterium]